MEILLKLEAAAVPFGQLLNSLFRENLNAYISP